MSANPIAVPLIMTEAGPQPTPPATLRAAIAQGVAAQVPGYEANLPGTLIEDLLSTAMGAVTTLDQGRCDAISNAIPIAAAPFFLYLLGAQFGIAQGVGSNTSVDVVFSGPVGFVIPSGTLITDGTYQYQTQHGVVIGSNGQSAVVTALATQSGIWTPLAGTVTALVTQFSGYSITVTNPEQGTPGTGPQSVQSYRGQVVQRYQMPAQSLDTYLTGLLQSIPGVNPLWVKVRQVPTGWEVICGGGDNYAVAYAILQAVVDLSTLVGSSTTSRNITVSIINAPNTLNIIYVNPPAQTVTGSVTWNTNLPNFAQAAQVNQLGQQAIAAYLNGIQVGDPINLNVASQAFISAVSGTLAPANVSALNFALQINGTDVSPEAGTEIILSDPESYFSAAANAVTVAQA